jgi:hypothetical protein
MADPKDLPQPGASNFSSRVREELMRLMGKIGDSLDQVVTKRELIAAGLAQLRPGTQQIEPTPSTNSGSTAREPDLTPPPQPDGFAATGAISHVLIEHATPAYTQGGGHLRTRVYGAKYTSGDLPTFSDAVEVGQFIGTMWGLTSDPGTTWRLWIKWETADGVLSPTPAGGTNGLAVATGQNVSAMVNAMTGPGNPFKILAQPTTIDGVTYAAGTYSVQSFILNAQITNAKIADLAVDSAKIANLAVDSSKIADLAVDGAKIADAAITSAKIGNAEVNTLNIAGQAVTFAVSSFSNSPIEVPCTNTWITVQSATIKTTGEKLFISMFLRTSASYIYNYTDGWLSGKSEIRLLKDGYPVMGDSISEHVTYGEHPEAGTYTYSIQVRHYDATSQEYYIGKRPMVFHRSIFIMETKR